MLVELLVRPLLRPFAKFFRREATGGLVLLVSAVLALLLALSEHSTGTDVAKLAVLVASLTAGYSMGCSPSLRTRTLVDEITDVL